MDLSVVDWICFFPFFVNTWANDVDVIFLIYFIIVIIIVIVIIVDWGGYFIPDGTKGAVFLYWS